MKSLLKKTAFLTAILISSGLLLLFVGFFLGGGMDLTNQVKIGVSQMRTTVKDSLKMLPMMKTFFNLDEFGFDSNQGKMIVSINENYEEHEGDYSDLNIALIGEIRNLQITSLSGNLQIKQSPDNRFGIESSYCGKYQYYVEDETLYLAVFPAFKKDIPGKEPTIILYLPPYAYYEDVYIYFQGEKAELNMPMEGKQGYFIFPSGSNNTCAYLDFEDIHILSGVSKTKVEYCNTTDLTLDVGIGEIAFDELSADKLLANVGSGRIDICGDIRRNADLTCGMGQIRIESIRNHSYYNYDINGSSFLIHTGGDNRKDLYVAHYEDNSSANSMKITSAFGTVQLFFNE